MEYRVEMALPVSADQAWAVLADLRSWPTWTPTVESIVYTAERPRHGLPVTIKQPGRRPARYVIDMADESALRFRWGSNRAGVRQWADHVITPTGASSSSVVLTFAMLGPVGRPLAALAAGKIRTMVDTEADSLRTHLTTTL